jgi:hypothetical protein
VAIVNGAVVSDAFFDQVRDAFEGFVAALKADLHTTTHSRGIKAWFGEATREHYEAQLIRAEGGVRLEIGFHLEYPKAKQNRDLLEFFVTCERDWRPSLGEDAETGAFIGRDGWCRISELWDPPESGEIDDIIDVAARLADYVLALEPVRLSHAD